MARLTAAHWAQIRDAWEKAPDVGFQWLTLAGGGPWPVSREAIRLRCRAEGWAKRPPDPPTRLDGSACPGGSGAGLFDCAFDPADVDLDDGRPLCEALQRQHRRDWLGVREVASAAVASGVTDAVRRAKLTAELVREIQNGEARVLGLDADRIDFDAMSDAELERVARGGRVR